LSKNWTLMATHGVVLLYIAANPSTTMREMSDELSMTERRISQVVHDLADAELLEVTRTGRRNNYAVKCSATSLVHPSLANVPLSRLVDAAMSA
jgi:DNA-binding transcriptional regulator GbsR (MarR family)